jgi:hypothetical protein
MSNYPDDIRNYDRDPRSPFYEDTKDDAMEEFRSTLIESIDGCIRCLNYAGVDVILKEEIDVDLVFTEWLYCFVADNHLNVDECLAKHSKMIAFCLVEEYEKEINKLFEGEEE